METQEKIEKQELGRRLSANYPVDVSYLGGYNNKIRCNTLEKEKIVKAYSDFIKRKYVELEELRYQETLSGFRDVFLEKIEDRKVRVEVLKIRLRTQLANERLNYAKGKLETIGSYRRRPDEKRVDLDHSDFENRAEIQREGVDIGFVPYCKSKTLGPVLCCDDVANKLYDIFFGKKPFFASLYRSDSDKARGLLLKMANRTMTEEEYGSLAEISLGAILKKWHREYQSY